MITRNKRINRGLFGSGLFIALLAGVSSCDRFLDEPPSKNTSLVVTTTDQLNALLNNYEKFHIESNNTMIFSTDDYGLNRQMYDALSSAFMMEHIFYAFWDTQFIPGLLEDKYWSEEFAKIFTANMVLNNLEQVSGPESDKAILKADAHFVRAYSYYELVNTYCLPYTEANRNEMGLPLKQNTSFEEPVERRPLHEVYEQIESDLQEALKITVPLKQGGRNRMWRANTAAVNGFAARYYLTRNNYEQALTYAEKSLALHHELVNYNTEMRYGQDQVITLDPGTPEERDLVLKFPYTHDNQFSVADMLDWKECLYLRALKNISWLYLPSADLLNLYDKENDLRYEYHYVDHFLQSTGFATADNSWPGYVFFFRDRILSGPTVAEMYLIKAESLARLGRVDDALEAVNTLRASRFKPGPWVNLTASTPDEAITKVLQERRRELPFVHRWFDMRRLNHNDYAADDIKLEKEFYPYTQSRVDSEGAVTLRALPPGSRRYATPIPQQDITNSQQRIIQNTY